MQELDTTLQVLGIDGAPAESSMSSPHALAALRRDSSSGFRLHHSESGGTLRCDYQYPSSDAHNMHSDDACATTHVVPAMCSLHAHGAALGCM